MVFYGEYEVAITEGGRIALPKKIRENLSQQSIVLTKGFGVCLAGYDRSDWENRAESLLSVSLLDQNEIGKRRMLFSSTVYIELDEQGRLLVPKGLAQFAALSKRVVVAGIGDHFEIWEPSRWEDYLHTEGQ